MQLKRMNVSRIFSSDYLILELTSQMESFQLKMGGPPKAISSSLVVEGYS